MCIKFNRKHPSGCVLTIASLFPRYSRFKYHDPIRSFPRWTNISAVVFMAHNRREGEKRKRDEQNTFPEAGIISRKRFLRHWVIWSHELPCFVYVALQTDLSPIACFLGQRINKGLKQGTGLLYSRGNSSKKALASRQVSRQWSIWP